MPIVPVCTHKYRDFRDKIPDGVNPLRTSEPLIYVSSAMARLNAKRSTERLFEFTAMPIPMCNDGIEGSSGRDPAGRVCKVRGEEHHLVRCGMWGGIDRVTQSA